MDEAIEGSYRLVLEEVLKYSNEGFLIIDGKGQVLYFNKAWKMLCIDFILDREIVGSYVHELDEYIKVHTVAAQVFRTKKPHSKVYSPTKKRIILASGKPIFDHQGKLQLIIVKVNDISELFLLRDQIDNFNRIKELYMEYLRSHTRIELNPIQADTKMQNLYQKCLTIAVTDVTILLMGESGSGKDVVANFIHNNSLRKNRPFLSINCGAVPGNLMESELFGYTGGAFTGASKTGKKGIFEAAHLGTLFLDEIAEMPQDMQVKLLRVLETKEIRPVGSTKTIPIDVRIIVATNKNLREMVKEGKFRKDLYYRINVISMTLPPLRERPADILALANYYLEMFNLQYHYNDNKKEFASELKELFQQYTWPGNVRELRNVVEQMVILTEGDIITTKFFETMASNGETNRDSSMVSVNRIAELNDIIDETERQLFERAVATKKSSREIAKMLNVSQTTVMRKLHKYELKTESGEE